MKKLLLLSYAVFFSLFAFAQATQVSGKITDENNNPLSGVSISIKNRGASAKTGSDGTFTFTTTQKGSLTLTASSVGYTSKSFLWAGKDVNVILDKANKVEDEVVVVGYSTVKRKDLLASVSSVSAKDLKDIPINSAAEALNGRLAGVTATTAEGSPDANINIRVRGGMSITNDNSPLYVIDGIVVENALSTISPQDIQSLDVLKDAAATAIYGARGGNGVIVITTKTGKIGKLKVSYNGFVGVKVLANKLGVLNPLEFVKFQSERSRGSATDSTTFLKNYGTTWDTLANYANAPFVDWQDEVFGQTGTTTNHNITASGGNKVATYNFGYTFVNDKAIVRNSSFQRHQLNGKTDIKISKKIKLGLGVRVTDQNVYGAGVSDDRGTSYNRLRNTIRFRPYLSSFQDLDDQDLLADPNAGNGLAIYNPISLAGAEYRKKSTQGYTFTTSLGFNFNKHFSFRSTFGYDINNVIDRKFNDSITPYSIVQAARKPNAFVDTTKRQTISNTNVITYNLKGYKKKHDLEVLIGEETNDIKTQAYSIATNNFPLFITPKNAFNQPELGVSLNGYPKVNKVRATIASFFSSVKYSYKEKYLMTFNVRADGSSKFLPGKQWGYFPAGSVAWRVSNEKFMENVKFINNLKFRVGYGLVGNNRIDDYLYLTTFNNNGTFYYGINNQSVNAYTIPSLVNTNLKWESTENKNIGLDVSFLKSRIDLSVDVYQNDSRDLLLNVPVAPTYGFTTQYQNVGKTSNKGIEVQLNTVIIRKPNNFTWNANFNISHNQNKIEKLGLNQTQFFPASSWFTTNPTDYIARIGEPVGSMYGLVTDGFYTTDDFNYNTATSIYTLKPGVVNNSSIIGVVQPGSLKFKDLNGDGIIDVNNDRQIIGNPTPKFTGGLSQQLTYKQWDLNVFVNFSYGNDVYNANKIELTNSYTSNSNVLDIMENRWKTITPSGQTAQWVNGTSAFGIAPDQLKALNANATIWQPLRSAGAFVPHSWAIEDGSFIRINNVSLGYSLPVKSLVKMKMSKLRLYATANNLAVFTNYTGYDPEVSVRRSGLTPGLDYSAYPKSRSFIFGINATF